MKRLAIGCLVVFVVFVAVIGIAVFAGRSRARVRANSWLEIRFEGPYAEYRPSSLLAALSLQDEPLLRDVTDAIDAAAEDPKIVGIIARTDDLKAGWAQTEEIRDRILAFRKSGKKAVCQLETAGEFASGNLPYYLASAFDTVYLAPSGDVNLVGVMVQAMFLRGTFDWLGIYPDIEHIGDYKTAANMYTEKAFTPAHREMYDSLGRSLQDNLAAGIAAGRGLRPEAVRSLFDRAPFLAKEALEAKLVDGLKYRDEVWEELKAPGEDTLRTVKLSKYIPTVRRHGKGRKAIGVVYGVGPVIRGRSDADATGAFIMGSDTVTRLLREAADDDGIAAIVFRVDSPGGSYVASDQIWREVVRAREEKPVVVSMGDVAGSGGYFVAMPANEIVAHPSTLTGSIGVLGGKLDLSGLYNKVGVTKDHIALTAAADLYYDYQRFTPAQKQIQWKMLNRIYDDFSHKAAEGRHMKWEDVDRIGRGRVWTGAQAKEIGLVDHLGGMDVAIARARELGGIGAEEPVRLKYFPPARTLWQALTARDEDNALAAAARGTQRLAAGFGRILEAAARAGSGTGDDALAMPPVTAR